MEEELRFGNYTKKQIEGILLAGLFPHEIELLNEGLQLLNSNFQDYFFPSDDSIWDEENKIDTLKLAGYQPGLKIIEARKKLTDEQNLIVDKFFLLTFKVIYLNTQFLILIGQKEEAIQGYEGILTNNNDLKRRFMGEFPHEKLGESFRLMQDYLGILKQNPKKELNWNGSDDLLSKVSVKLFETGTTCSETDFFDVLKKNKKCEINKKRRGFFVLLIYTLLDYEKPLLTAKNDSAKGVIVIASKYFFENTKNGPVQISFIDVKKRLKGQSDSNTEIKLEVSEFMQEFESFLPQF